MNEQCIRCCGFLNYSLEHKNYYPRDTDFNQHCTFCADRLFRHNKEVGNAVLGVMPNGDYGFVKLNEHGHVIVQVMALNQHDEIVPIEVNKNGRLTVEVDLEEPLHVIMGY